jgi:hypothetical protein
MWASFGEVGDQPMGHRARLLPEDADSDGDEYVYELEFETARLTP